MPRFAVNHCQCNFNGLTGNWAIPLGGVVGVFATRLGEFSVGNTGHLYFGSLMVRLGH